MGDGWHVGQLRNAFRFIQAARTAALSPTPVWGWQKAVGFVLKTDAWVKNAFETLAPTGPELPSEWPRVAPIATPRASAEPPPWHRCAFIIPGYSAPDLFSRHAMRKLVDLRLVVRGELVHDPAVHVGEHVRQ